MKALKWIGIAVGGLIVLIVAALLIIPMFVDLNDYKPQIEQQVTAMTGRSFSIGGDIDLSLFPWAGVALSDIRLGNPPGFDEKQMAGLEAFEVRVKLFPLIFRDIQVKRFVVQRPRIVLIRQKDGSANWEGFGGAEKSGAGPAKEKTPTAMPSETEASLPIETLTVGEFAVTDGSVRYVDRGTGSEHTVSDLTLRLTDVSLDRPVPLVFSAQVDGKPISLEGTVGPVGRQPGKGDLGFDLIAKALGQLEVTAAGKVSNAASKPQVDVTVSVSPFSPRKLVSAMGQPFPLETKDPGVLKKVSMKAGVRGGPESISLVDGILTIDDSTAKFSAQVSEFEKPKASFDMQLDRIDLDRYLPAGKEEKAEKKEKAPTTGKEKKEKTDYEPLRRLVLDGKARIGELKAAGVKMKDVRLTVSAKDGVIRLDPLALSLYGGDMAAGLNLDVRTDTPKADLRLGLARLAVNPLLNDLLKKDFLEGAASAKIALSFAGDSAKAILKTLSGGGQLAVKDGAIKGVDLTSMARNIQSAFGAANQGADKPRTEFSELVVPFSIKNGVASIPGTTLESSRILFKADGKADLVDRVLDLRLDPRLKGTGQGDAQGGSGLTVPINVSGSFSSLKFAPDLEGALKEKIKELTSPEGLQKLFPSGKKEEGAAKPEEQVKDLIKALPFGKKK
ncbi:MAG: AsmA family protein [Desulfobacterales bacterium]|nr:AsmA family protein [Desulfobacterales bacterium]